MNATNATLAPPTNKQIAEERAKELATKALKGAGVERTPTKFRDELTAAVARVVLKPDPFVVVETYERAMQGVKALGANAEESREVVDVLERAVDAALKEARKERETKKREGAFAAFFGRRKRRNAEAVSERRRLAIIRRVFRSSFVR